MANQYFIGGASAVAQLDTFTPAGSITTSDINTLTVKDEAGNTLTTVSFTTTGTTTAAAVSAGLIAAWAANTIAAAIATASGSSTVILTAVTAGRAQYITSSVTGVGTLTKAATTANSSPTDWNTAANWSGGTVPVSTDGVVLDGRMPAAGILQGLNQSGVTLATLFIDLASGIVGTQKYALKIGATAWIIGRNLTGSSQIRGAGRINLDFGTAQFSGEVLTSNTTPTDTGQETIRIKGTHASNVLGVSGGLVGVNTNLPGDTSTVPTISCSGGILNVASGTTTTTVTNAGGTVNVGCAATTINNSSSSGSTTTQGTGLVGTINAIAGTVKAGNRITGGNSVTTANLLGGTIDLTVDPRPVQIGTLNLGGGSLIQISSGQAAIGAVGITWGNSDTLTTALSA